jgi:hypothetical protein
MLVKVRGFPSVVPLPSTIKNTDVRINVRLNLLAYSQFNTFEGV